MIDEIGIYDIGIYEDRRESVAVGRTGRTGRTGVGAGRRVGGDSSSTSDNKQRRGPIA